MTFIIHYKDGSRKTYSNRYNEDDEHERDAAWDDVYLHFPKAIINELGERKMTNVDYYEEF